MDKPTVARYTTYDMRTIAHIILIFFANAVALAVATALVDGFSVRPSLLSFVRAAGIFTLIYFVVRPIIKLVLTPIIIVTLGLGVIVVNAITLYILDMVSEDIVITGLRPLAYATLVIGAVHLLVHFSAKHLHSNNHS